MAPHPVVPPGPDPLELNILEASSSEPVDVLLLRGEEHPRVREEPRDGVRRVHGPDDAREPPRFEDSVGLADAALGLWPVLDAASRHVTVLAVCLKGQVLGIALEDGYALELLLLLCFCELVRGLIDHSDLLGTHPRLDDAERAEAGACAHIDSVQVMPLHLGRLESLVAHLLGPVPRVDDRVVDYREKAVEGQGLLLVLHKPLCKGRPRTGCRKGHAGRRAY
mmetsp:Transcript_7999/g.19619  ORF Transcript_7999/g.19619 Transcript_7999/m.19619 type:complete len:223 (-) Transcript_7999:119-787(-)